MGLFDNKFFKKEKKRETLAWNRVRGKMAEDNFVAAETLKGNTVTRTGRGHDFKVTRRNVWGKARGTTYHEVKSSRRAPVSRLQKKMKRKLKGRYRVERPHEWF